MNIFMKMQNFIIKKLISGFLLGLFFVIIFNTNNYSNWVSNNNRYMYMNNQTGQYVVNNWVQTSNGYYYLDANGYMVTGWYLINGKYYYFNDDGLMVTGFLDWQNNTYYLNPENGQMVVGWVQRNDLGVINYLYFDENNGAMIKSWKQINKDWYYFYDGNCLINVWAEINGAWYHFDPSGKMSTGWIENNNKIYYLSPANGQLQKGWIQDDKGNQYYLKDQDGSLARSEVLMIAGTNYTFNEYGMLTNVNQNNVATSQSSEIGTYHYNMNSIQGNVSIGISPGTLNNSAGITYTEQLINQNTPLTYGQTTGPQ